MGSKNNNRGSMWENLNNNKTFQDARKAGFRSGLEHTINKQLEKNNIEFNYEETVINYQIPAVVKKYHPDFDCGIFIIEAKGKLDSADRKKHRLVKEQNPEYDIRFVFSNSAQKINKNSDTSYADWCVKYGFKFADKVIPEEWIKEIGERNEKANSENKKKTDK